MYYIGIDLGGTNIAGGVVSEDHKIIYKKSVRTGADRGPDAVAKDIAALISALTEEAGLTPQDIAAAGIASPGAINGAEGVVERACNLYMEGYPLSQKVKENLPCPELPVTLENDANAAALGEAVAGAAKGSRFSVMITLGTGVGGGIVLEGKVYSGFNFAGGEFGHMVIEHGGRPCNCGRRGCWEAYSSATALIEMTKERMAQPGGETLRRLAEEYGKVSAKTAFVAKRAGDPAGDELVKQYIDYLACGISNVINLLSPDIITIGGGICNEGDALLRPLTEKVYSEIFTKNYDMKTEIRIAALGNDAGIIGAAVAGKK